jgi:hypothetical protein
MENGLCSLIDRSAFSKEDIVPTAADSVVQVGSGNDNTSAATLALRLAPPIPRWRPELNWRILSAIISLR